MSAQGKKILIVSNTSWYLFNFRIGFIKRLVHEGCDVTLYAPVDEYTSRLTSLGVGFVEMKMNNKGKNIFIELLTSIRFWQVYKKIKPDYVFNNTIKPNIYGSIAAGLLNIPFINTVTGLGTVFIRLGILQVFVKLLYRITMFRARKVFFQNYDDKSFFVSQGILPGKICDYIPGSGIDLQKFALAPTRASEVFVFLFVGRVLKDKGVVEFVEAARLMRQKYGHVEFHILGFLDAVNVSAISKDTVADWVSEGVIKYLGSSDNVGEVMAGADCIVLPSYREGLPRTLLEACAVGRPIIATDVIGCRDVVIDGYNGLMCDARSVTSLYDAFEKMVGLDSEERRKMGLNGRHMVAEKFDEKLVIEKYLLEIS